MAIDINALKTELTTDPLARGYAGMTDAQAAASLNTVNRPLKIDIPADTMRAQLMIKGTAIWDKLNDAAASHAQPAAKTAAQGFVDAVKWMQGAWPTSDPSMMTAYTARLDSLAAATPPVLTAGQRTAALALTDSLQSRATELGWSTISYTDVALARAA